MNQLVQATSEGSAASEGSKDADNLVVFVLDDFLSKFTSYLTDLNHKSTEQFLTRKNSEDVDTLKSLQAEGAFLNTGQDYEALAVSGTAVAFVTATEGAAAVDAAAASGPAASAAASAAADADVVRAVQLLALIHLLNLN